jgi:hypothetical protein
VPGLPVAAGLVLSVVADDSNSTVAGLGWRTTRVTIAVKKSLGHPKGSACGTMGEIHRAFPSSVERVGRCFKPASDTGVAALKARELNLLADAVTDHLDADAIERLIIEVVSAGPDFIAPEAIGGRT